MSSALTVPGRLLPRCGRRKRSRSHPVGTDEAVCEYHRGSKNGLSSRRPLPTFEGKGVLHGTKHKGLVWRCKQITLAHFSIYVKDLTIFHLKRMPCEMLPLQMICTDLESTILLKVVECRFYNSTETMRSLFMLRASFCEVWWVWAIRLGVFLGGGCLGHVWEVCWWTMNDV